MARRPPRAVVGGFGQRRRGRRRCSGCRCRHTRPDSAMQARPDDGRTTACTVGARTNENQSSAVIIARHPPIFLTSKNGGFQA